MNTTIDYLKSNRKWLVLDYSVWGDNGTFRADMVLVEFVPGNNRVVFSHQFTGDSPQIVYYADLVDHRGNQLPGVINNPAVIIIAKNPVPSFILGPVGDKSFRIAKDSGQPADSIVDLLIMEMK